jgi:hypothetical protein
VFQHWLEAADGPAAKKQKHDSDHVHNHGHSHGHSHGDGHDNHHEGGHSTVRPLFPLDALSYAAPSNMLFCLPRITRWTMETMCTRAAHKSKPPPWSGRASQDRRRGSQRRCSRH